MDHIFLISAWYMISVIVHGCYPIAAEYAKTGILWRGLFLFYVIAWPIYLVDMLLCIVFKRDGVR